MRFDLPVPEDPARTLRGVVQLPPGEHAPRSLPWLLVVHGYSGHGQWGFFPALSDRLAARGVATVRPNLSGGGIGADLETFEDRDVFGRATYVDELTDLARVRGLVEDGFWPALDPARGAILGHSRGGAMALVHAAEAGGYRALVTWAAMSTVVRFSEERLAEWRRNGFVEVLHFGIEEDVRLDVSVLESAERNLARLDPLVAAAKLDCPVLVVHGARDRGCTLEDAAAIRDASGGRLHVVEGGGHAFGARHPLTKVPPPLEELLAETTAFLEAGLCGA